MSPAPLALNKRSQGWLRHVYRKAMTPDDWTRAGEPNKWWDQYSTPPMLNFPRFDLSESTYPLALMADVTPAWREVYAQILDQLIARHTTFWAAVDWLTQFGHDPKRGDYPEAWKGTLVPDHLWGKYDAPGWTANGVDPWGLQPDPIGSDGNLFFRGFLNLMLSIYRYVSGDDKWDKPFPVAGLEDQTFDWTHSRIASFLADQWEQRPEGPHCENTKIWPFCLSAAGLGLQLTDVVSSTKHHWIYDRWTEEHLKKKYMTFTPDGRMQSMGLYYDPQIDHVQAPNPIVGLAPCWYVVPQNRPLAEMMYQTAVTTLGWNNPAFTVMRPPDLRFLTMGLVLAQEFGDVVTAARLRTSVEEWCEPRFFGSDDGEFGFWFRLGEEYPRGQMSAFLMLGELVEEGSWWRLFNHPNLAKFDQPTVVGVDYPKIGLSRAFNDEDGVLHFTTYPATAPHRGDPTTFRVEHLRSSASITVRRDNADYDRWHSTAANVIEIDTDIDAHDFEVFAATAARSQTTTRSKSSPSPSTTSVRATDLDAFSAVRDAGLLLISGAGTCPCCA
ncbi:MAG: hypothetical protein DMD49_00915 [Gemmatimonadetes bacterium]|nr:MAG: hypothetical protein DMD49_00915 [Gemmatimonadota bacterium]